MDTGSNLTSVPQGPTHFGRGPKRVLMNYIKIKHKSFGLRDGIYFIVGTIKEVQIKSTHNLTFREKSLYVAPPVYLTGCVLTYTTIV